MECQRCGWFRRGPFLAFTSSDAPQAVSVVPGSPAAPAGLRTDDVLVPPAGAVLVGASANAGPLMAWLLSQASREIRIRVRRGGATVSLQITAPHPTP